jgi:hypothetical protein
MEGTLLYWYLRNNGLWTRDLKDRLEDHAKRTVGLSPAIWMLAEIPCPLLSTTKECKAYSARPFMCRTAFSSGDPDLCRPANFSLATPMVDRQDALQMFHDLEQQTHKAQGVFYWNMPISMAVLLGARIGEGTMTLSESEYAIFSAHLEAES